MTCLWRWTPSPTRKSPSPYAESVQDYVNDLFQEILEEDEEEHVDGWKPSSILARIGLETTSNPSSMPSHPESDDIKRQSQPAQAGFHLSTAARSYRTMIQVANRC